MKRILLTILTVCGFVSARAELFEYSVSLSPVASPPGATGTGSGSAVYDDAAHSLQLQLTFSGLSGTTSASHIHAVTTDPFTGTAGVATTLPSFDMFPLGVTSGSFSNTLDLTLASSWNNAFVTAHTDITGAETALSTAMAEGKAYWNVHTTTFAGGEINGFFVAVPEPSSLALLGLGAVGMMLCDRGRRRVC